MSGTLPPDLDQPLRARASAPALRAAADTRLTRVCLAGPSMDILGGQAVQLERLLERLRRTPGIEVGFIAMNPRLPGPLKLLQRIKYVRTIVNSIAYLVSLLRRVGEYDVVHAFSPSYWAYLLGPVPAMAIARMYGRGAILNYHSGEAEDHFANWRSAVPLTRLAHRIVVPSNYLRDVFQRFGLDAQAIHNFVDADRFPYRERTVPRPRFLSNRNLEPLYNVACAVRAFARVQAVVPDAELVIAGYGSQREPLEALVKELGLTSVRFAGRVSPDEMVRLLDEADILLNSPDIDNMPLSLIEAQAAGLPIVSSSAGGIPYMVAHERTGMLVPSNDSDAMAAAAIRVLQEPGLAARLSRQGREHCLTNYAWPVVEEAWQQLYRDVASMSRMARA